MTIQGTNGVSAGIQAGTMGMGQAGDPVSQNIQRQIADAQKQLQELSTKTDMSVEDKAKRRQELQKEINDLNNQLRQHQIEKRREKQQEKASSEDVFGNSQAAGASKADSRTNGLSMANMEGMIMADVSMKQANVQGSVATKMEGRAGVLGMEIKLDGARGGDTARKQAELADVEKKAANAADSALETLADANKAIEAAAKTEQAAKGTKEEAGKSGRETKEEEDMAREENKEEKQTNMESGQVVDVRL